MIRLLGQFIYFGNITTQSVIVQAISNNEFVGYFESEVIDGDRVNSGFWLMQQGANFKRSRLLVLELRQELIERFARIDYIFNNYDVPVNQVDIQSNSRYYMAC